MHAFLLTVCAALAALAVPQAPGTGAPTVSRLVLTFSGLEGQLLDAARAGDAVRVDGLLADAFEMRTAAAPAAPVPRAEWTRSALQEFRLRAAGVSEMAARELGPVVVVSFRLTQAGAAGGADASGEFFVTDVWSQEQGTWRLQARYVDTPGGRRPLGAPGAHVTIEKKY